MRARRGRRSSRAGARHGCSHHSDVEPSPRTLKGTDAATIRAASPSRRHSEETMAISSETVTYTAGTTTLRGFLAKPSTDVQRAGVLVVHEWWGLNDYIRGRA